MHEPHTQRPREAERRRVKRWSCRLKFWSRKPNPDPYQAKAFLLGFQKTDLKLKDRLDYAYRNFVTLRDLCLGLGLFMVTSEVGLRTYGHSVLAQSRARAKNIAELGVLVSGVFIATFVFLMMDFAGWMRTQLPLFGAAEVPSPPHKVILWAIGVFLVAAILFFIGFLAAQS